jgi:hypothetical protein
MSDLESTLSETVSDRAAGAAMKNPATREQERITAWGRRLPLIEDCTKVPFGGERPGRMDEHELVQPATVGRTQDNNRIAIQGTTASTRTGRHRC